MYIFRCVARNLLARSRQCPLLPRVQGAYPARILLRGFIAAAVLGIILVCAIVLWRDKRPEAAVRRAFKPVSTSAPKAQRVVTTLFSDQAGDRLACVRVERVVVESGRAGFLRIAAYPVVVLEGVTLEIDPKVAWPEAGSKIHAALRQAAGGDYTLRSVQVQFAGADARRIFAPTARYRREGALELIQALDPGVPSGPATQWLWLTGPQAGRLVTPPENIIATHAPQPPFPTRAARLD